MKIDEKIKKRLKKKLSTTEIDKFEKSIIKNEVYEVSKLLETSSSQAEKIITALRKSNGKHIPYDSDLPNELNWLEEGLETNIINDIEINYPTNKQKNKSSLSEKLISLLILALLSVLFVYHKSFSKSIKKLPISYKNLSTKSLLSFLSAPLAYTVILQLSRFFNWGTEYLSGSQYVYGGTKIFLEMTAITYLTLLPSRISEQKLKDSQLKKVVDMLTFTSILFVTYQLASILNWTTPSSTGEIVNLANYFCYHFFMLIAIARGVYLRKNKLEFARKVN
ncbi:hypothetical protein [Aliagarivorans marinus]|uniref:hypothetical protein n=1 Tax=Aliagarivorans marinus TaxID=561965 RepID=UPI00041D0219|nr:hypothetical protein [Aliagarivorans marinus]